MKPKRLLRGHSACGMGLFAFFTATAAAQAIPLFQEIPNAFGTQSCSGAKQGCWTNYLRVTDIDKDGDLDVLFPNADGYFTQGQSQPFVVYANDGNAGFTNVSATAVGGYTGYLRQVAVGDVNGDGAPDIYAPSAWGAPDFFFINDGTGIFVNEAATRLPGVASHAGAARFGDVDNDGDLDLLVSDGWAQNSAFVAHLYLNVGNGIFTDATDNLPTTKSGDQPIDFDLLDVDGDFDLDLLIDMHTGRSSLWRNDGTGVFTDITIGIPNQPGLHYGPVACDVDGDGDLDIWTDNAGPNYTEQLLINNGSGAFADETAARVTGNVNADDNGLACVDIDGDGDFDAIVMSLSNVERVLLNDGTGHFTLIADAFPAIGDGTLWLDVGDLNGDGRLDVVTGQGESSYLDRAYLGNANMVVDTFAPKFRAVETVGEVLAGIPPVVRFAVTDSATTDEGPRLQKASVRVTTVDSMTEVRARFMGGDMFRAVLPDQSEGTMVSYTVCATDVYGNEGCAPTQSYLVVNNPTTSSSGSGGMAGAGGNPTTSGNGGQGGEVPDKLILDKGGCGCTTPGQKHTGGAAAVYIALALLAYRRRPTKKPAQPRR